MQTMLLTLIALLLLVAVIQLVLLAADLRALRQQVLPRIYEAIVQSTTGGWTTQHNHLPPIPQPHSGMHQSGGFVKWYWRGGQWYAPEAPQGCDPGLPPSFPGAFENDVAKTWRSMAQ